MKDAPAKLLCPDLFCSLGHAPSSLFFFFPVFFSEIEDSGKSKENQCFSYLCKES